ncbi:MAG TPA: hypothetical protein VFD04_24410, partial [Actinomycetes bacterium]|nr:hypothetical protein [Actinomycetes bacterium]
MQRPPALVAALLAAAALGAAGCTAARPADRPAVVLAQPAGEHQHGGAAPAAAPVAAKPGTELKIIQWSHFVPAYDEWFNKKYVLEWGQANNVKVTVDNINQADHPARSAAEVSAKQGHDIFDWFSVLYAHIYREALTDVSDIAEPI